jgi:hypothetical protein
MVVFRHLCIGTFMVIISSASRIVPRAGLVKLVPITKLLLDADYQGGIGCRPDANVLGG